MSEFNTVAVEDQYCSGVTAHHPITIERGSGPYLWDAQGNRYIDCVAGYGTANVGHCHPKVTAAIQKQAAELVVCPGCQYNEVRARLLEKLVELAPGDINRVYLGNSGTESVEAALKFARLSTGRQGIVATKRAFHGRSMGALSATWESKYRDPYLPLVPGFSHVTYNDIEAMDAAITDETAGVILEVVQGEGGIYPGTGEYLRAVQQMCRERGAMFIVDEVQSGCARTGRFFACEHYDLEPDIICLAKSLAGGVPIGATLIGPRVENLAPSVHGTTFGGNPLAAAAALATIEVIEEEHLAERAEALGIMAKARLQQIESPLIREVRGLGLMIGVDLRVRPGKFVNALFDEGVMALTAGHTVLRLLPTLVIGEDDLMTACDAVERVLMAEE